MLGNKRKARAGSGATTLISQDTVVVGNIQFAGTLDVEGLVQGDIVARPDTEALVRVVGKGRVEGEIRAPNVVINGAIQGDVHASGQLELAPRARVEGNVFYTLVEMSAGAEVNGSMTHVSTAAEAGPGEPRPEGLEPNN